MKSETNHNRKIARDFLGKVEMAKKTPQKVLEQIFMEIYEEGIKRYIKRERERFPNKPRKQILIEMYELKEKLKGRKQNDE
jgi:hemerythrin-like domain-containing protein